MKRNLIIIIALFLLTFIFILLGNVIIVAEKAAQISHLFWVEYVVYAICFVPLCLYVVIPVIKVHRAPEFPALTVDEQWNREEVYRFGMRLVANCNYITKEHRKEHQANLKADIKLFKDDAEGMMGVIRQEIHRRFAGDKAVGAEGINEKIKQWAITVFLVTAVSQNSKIDSISVLALNYKMIEDIILSSGFKPTKPQLFKQYVRVLSTALISYLVSDALSGTEGIALFEGLADSPEGLDEIGSDLEFDQEAVDMIHDDSNIFVSMLSKVKIPGFIVSSGVDGSVNALLTLRIGYVTKYYLQHGAQGMQGKGRIKARKEALKSALSTMPAVITESSARVGKKSTDMVSSWFKFGKK